ncbi:TolB amino-terminal domain-containing protein [Kaistia soli DSM 19436]|uniref:TolB amino-terminal domain-containing protein n=1 Tax=Kaistia soli DSM 19436 TaxID=1122133 RepID=A0A1M5PA25_9HYPH|nr:hypothetical protein [Kaistia soli]SHG98602.1 TolB amino-terminal domain-containing protein [Kaistia soli DSM 19436]
MESTLGSSGPGNRLDSGRPDAAVIRAQVEHMLASPELHGSQRRRTFLRYLVEETLEGRGGGLKGYTIALAVFGRNEEFQSQTDPVVRLEARRLRRDLDSYYIGAGGRDAIRITIPKGGYIPHFEWQNVTQPVLPAASTLAAPIVAPASDPAADLVDAAGRPSKGREGAKLGAAELLSRWPTRAGVAFALLGLATAAIIAWQRVPPAPDPAASRTIPLVVLPLASLSNNEDDQFLAAGMTQELITDLMRFEGFRLYSVAASFRQDADADPIDVGRKLGVAYLVKGSVRSDGATTRINAQLLDAGTGRVLWSEVYDRQRTPGALLKVQDELSASVAAELGQTYGIVNRSASAQLATPVASSMSDYDCVLRAYQYRRTFDEKVHEPVLSCLEQVTLNDPGYATAWAMLGWMHLDAARYGFVSAADAPREMDRAFAMASKAVEIAPESIVALQALSAVQYHLGQFDESERTQRHALAINPNDPDTIAQLGWRLALRGRWEEALPYVNRAVERSISPPGWYYDMITIRQLLDGKYREMLASAERSATGDPTGMSFLAIAQAATGDLPAAHQSLARMAEMSPALAREPERIYGNFRPIPPILDAVMTGLRNAGWTAPTK